MVGTPSKTPAADAELDCVAGNSSPTLENAASEYVVPIGPEVHAYCDRLGISSHLRSAIEMVQQSFPSLRDMQVRFDNDPEEDGEWIVIDVTVAEDSDRFLLQYDNCADHWIRRLPSDALGMIRLSYSLI